MTINDIKDLAKQSANQMLSNDHIKDLSVEELEHFKIFIDSEIALHIHRINDMKYNINYFIKKFDSPNIKITNLDNWNYNACQPITPLDYCGFHRDRFEYIKETEEGKALIRLFNIYNVDNSISYLYRGCNHNLFITILKDIEKKCVGNSIEAENFGKNE